MVWFGNGPRTSLERLLSNETALPWASCKTKDPLSLLSLTRLVAKWTNSLNTIVLTYSMCLQLGCLSRTYKERKLFLQWCPEQVWQSFSLLSSLCPKPTIKLMPLIRLCSFKCIRCIIFMIDNFCIKMKPKGTTKRPAPKRLLASLS